MTEQRPADGGPAVGTLVLDRFRLDGILAWGGQSVIYTATDGQGGRFVVKVGRPDTADPRAEDRLRQEAAILRLLSHPALVAFTDFGRDQATGLCCLVEELVPGVPLARLLADPELLDHRRSLLVLKQIAEGLEALHELGFVMRDLHPAQVMVSSDSPEGVSATIIDLGLARPMSRDEALTDPGQVAGAAGFLAPELIRGGEASPAADVYSLAAVAYTLLAGRPPFEAASPEMVMALQLTMPAPPLPGPLAAAGKLLGRALSTDPRPRPSTPGALVLELAGLLAVSTRRPGWGRIAGLVAAGLGLAAAIAAVALLMAN